MANKDFKQMLVRLVREGVIVGYEDRGGPHTRLKIAGGATYICPRSPSDWRAIRNAEVRMKKLAQE